MRAWLPCAGFVVAGAGLGLPALMYGCAGQSYGSCTDTGTCAGDDASMGGDSPIGSEGGHDGGGSGGDSATDGHPGDGPGISCDAATAIVCSGTCVDKETDPANCGTCGHSCSGPDAGTGTGTCVSGACAVSCQAEAGTTLFCPATGDCVDPTGIANCGTCGNGCLGPEAGPGHPVCQPGGMCAIACDNDGGPPEILCSGACVSPDDVSHCGTCTPCGPPPSGNGTPTCPAALCVMTCNAGYHPSGVACNTDCTLTAGDDPSTDPCVVADGLGIFVSPTGSDSSPADGSKEHPFGTIGHAMDTAESGGKRVYACGTFTGEQLVVGASRDGVKVYGGFDCTTWAYSASTKTKLAPTAAGFALQINGLTTGVTFEDFEFDSIAAPLAVAAAAGASSTAVMVNGAAGVVFRRVAMSAGAGQTGGPGTNGVNSWTSSSATSGSLALGTTAGQAIPCSCGGTGGQGGSAGTFNAGTDQFSPGGDGQDGLPLGIADHGTGIQQIGAGNGCTSGDQDGVSAGSGGAASLGGAGTGSLAFPQGWSNSAIGGTGGNGVFAQGGGGGGGYFYVVGATPAGAGGGGGCGGCGGAPGTGGFAGGSSIALITISSSVTLDTCSLTAASGGTGGKGGNGLGGQLGGAGGGGAGTSSCSGGAGGQGGEGGAGGGGVGGNSLAVAYSGTAPTETGAVTKTAATSAAPGGTPGGGNSTASSQGNPGLFQAEQSF